MAGFTALKVILGCPGAIISAVDASLFQLGVANLTLAGDAIAIELSSLFSNTLSGCSLSYSVVSANSSTTAISPELASLVSTNTTHLIISQNITSLTTFSLMASNVR